MSGVMRSTPRTRRWISWPSSQVRRTGRVREARHRERLAREDLDVGGPEAVELLDTMAWKPWTIETTAITAATPITMPSVVSTERIALVQIAPRAMRRFSRSMVGS